jgi:hypothetical protein
MDTDLHFYIFSGFGQVMDYPFFVGYPPDPPDTYIKITSTPPDLIFLSLFHIFSTASFTPSLLLSHPSITAPSLPHGITTSPAHPIFLPSSLSAFSLSFIITKLQWCSLSLNVLLGEDLTVTGWFQIR